MKLLLASFIALTFLFLSSLFFSQVTATVSSSSEGIASVDQANYLQPAPLSVFQTKETKDYNDNLMNTSKPYITNSTSIIIFMSFSEEQFTLTLTGENGTTSIIQVYCGNKGKPTSITPASADSGYNPNTKIQTLKVTHHSPEEIILNWTPEATVSDWLQIGLPYGFMAATLLTVGMVIVAGVALLIRDPKTMITTVIIVVTFMIVLYVFLVVLGAFTTI